MRRRAGTGAVICTGPRVRIAAALTALLVLAGCSASPDEAAERADAAFSTLVETASGMGAEVLRTVEVAQPVEQACGEDGEKVLTAWTATATAPVSADPAVLVGAADDLVAALVDSAPDASEREEEGRAPAWTSIEPAPGLDQRAVQDEHGTVVTVTVDGRVLVVAVFTPCAAP